MEGIHNSQGADYNQRGPQNVRANSDMFNRASGPADSASIKASEALTALSALKGKRAASAERAVLETLTREGMISCMESAEYQSLSASASKAQELGSQFLRGESERRSLERRLESLKEKYHSFTRYLLRFQWLRPESREQEALQIQTLEHQLQQEVARQTRTKFDYNQSSESAGRVSGFYPCAGGAQYAALTPKGETEWQRLFARRDLLADNDYRQISRGTELLMESMQARLERMAEARLILNRKGFPMNSEAVSQLALSAASQPEGLSDFCARSVQAAAQLQDKGWKKDARLSVSARIAALPEDMLTEWHNVDAAFRYLRDKQKYSGSSYRTWHVACSLLEIPEVDLQAQFARFRKMAEALEPRGWRQDSPESTYLALALAKMRGDPEALAADLKDLDRALGTAGLKSGGERAAAALQILRSPGTDLEKAKRVQGALELFATYGIQHSSSQHNYVAAAACSTLPGLLEGNIQSLAEVVKAAKTAGYKLTAVDNYVALLAEGIRDALTNSEEMPRRPRTERGPDRPGRDDLSLIKMALGLSPLDRLHPQGMPGTGLHSAPFEIFTGTREETQESLGRSRCSAAVRRWQEDRSHYSGSASDDNTSFWSMYFLSSDGGGHDGGGHGGGYDGGGYDGGSDGGCDGGCGGD